MRTWWDSSGTFEWVELWSKDTYIVAIPCDENHEPLFHNLPRLFCTTLREIRPGGIPYVLKSQKQWTVVLGASEYAFDTEAEAKEFAATLRIE